MIIQFYSKMLSRFMRSFGAPGSFSGHGRQPRGGDLRGGRSGARARADVAASRALGVGRVSGGRFLAPRREFEERENPPCPAIVMILTWKSNTPHRTGCPFIHRFS